MKYIIAIIQPGKLTAVHEALLDIGITGMTVTEVQGYGRQKGKSEIYRGAEYTVNFLPKVKIELALPAKMVAKAIEVIKTASSSGKIGDGKIFTFDLRQPRAHRRHTCTHARTYTYTSVSTQSTTCCLETVKANAQGGGERGRKKERHRE